MGVASRTPEGLLGGSLQLLNHGITTGALFFMVGFLYDRGHRRGLDDYGELYGRAPWLTFFFGVATLSSVGLPGLNGFVGEFMSLVGVARVMPRFVFVGVLGVTLAAAYALPAFQSVFLGAAGKSSVSAKVTDLVVLVVAADDGVMPQTVEAINHARAAHVPLVVAINKIDKSNANPERVKKELAQEEVLLEGWGGEVPVVQVSATKRQGIEDLLDVILLVAEMADLKAPPEGTARGTVLEARKERGRGVVASVLVQQGTLAQGDCFFAGATYGRVRAMLDTNRKPVHQGKPSDAVEIMGLEDIPEAGDTFQVVEDEARAREVAGYRRAKQREEQMAGSRKVSLEGLMDKIKSEEVQALNVVLKADVQGSVEVLRDTFAKLSTEQVAINVIHASTGAINANDILLASASQAIVIGFNVRPDRSAKELAEREKVDVRLYSVIYHLMEELQKAMTGLLQPTFKEEELGRAEVREVFKVSKVGTVAGCMVVEGNILRTAKARLLRDNTVVWEGSLASLKRFKDDVAEVKNGFECGIGLDRFQDIKLGDVIEAYRTVAVAPEA